MSLIILIGSTRLSLKTPPLRILSGFLWTYWILLICDSETLLKWLYDWTHLSFPRVPHILLQIVCSLQGTRKTPDKLLYLWIDSLFYNFFFKFLCVLLHLTRCLLKVEIGCGETGFRKDWHLVAFSCCIWHCYRVLMEVWVSRSYWFFNFQVNVILKLCSILVSGLPQICHKPSRFWIFGTDRNKSECLNESLKS